MNLFISFLILIFYVCGGVKLISSYKKQLCLHISFLIMQIRIMTLAKNVMTEAGVLPVNENTNQGES